MDRRTRPGQESFEAEFDACDPLGSVLQWSGRTESRAARVLQRRCRSEGVERSFYEDAHRDSRYEFDVSNCRNQRVNKSYFTLNNKLEVNRFHHEYKPATQNGDYIMANDMRRYPYQEQLNPKFVSISPTRPLSYNRKRQPKVEELLEKVEHDEQMMGLNKQPLKSILNYPKSPLPGILKKPRKMAESKTCGEGKRRQRAMSDSDNHCNYHFGPNLLNYDNRPSYLSSNTKRARDNTGTGYSYGSAIASIGLPPKLQNLNTYKYKLSAGKEQVRQTEFGIDLLKTTAINNETINEVVILEKKPSPACPVISPSLPVSSVTGLPVVKKPAKPKKKLKKVKVKKDHKHGNLEEAHSRSPSPDDFSTWQMETEAALAKYAVRDKSRPVPPAPAAAPAPAPVPPPPAAAPPLNNLHTITVVHQDAPKQDAANKIINGMTMSKAQPVLTDDTRSKIHQNILATLHTIEPFAKVANGYIYSTKDTPLVIPDAVASCIRKSIFPRVPPYIKFMSHDETVPLKVPLGIQKHLKWKMTTITPIVVKKTLLNSGFRLVKSECETSECPQEETVDWIGIWGKHMKSIMFRAIKDGQKMNHFPGTFQIGRKDRLWRNLQKLVQRHGLQEFGIMPKTYVLPHDMKLLKHDWEKHASNDEKWIIKPPASARGTGIKVVSRWSQIPKKRPVVVQKYVSKPYLINGSKFDMRLYVLITSMHPLRIYLYKDGLARFASVKYNDDNSSLNDRYMHLTNYSINRLSKSYTPNEDFAACEGHKWTLLSLFQYLKNEKKVDTDALWESMKDLVIKTIICGEASISSLTKANMTSRYNCYELFGVDVLLDENLKPWLLEVNISPSLHSASPLDIHVKGPLVTTVLNIAQFQVPMKTNLENLTKDKPHKLGGLPYDCRLYTVYLSKEERDKHIIYTNMEERDMYLRDILSTLTPDDVRHLVQSEDELTQCGDMERIFPSHRTHRYLAYLAGPRYYNRLFDAWETRYHHNRNAGHQLLSNLCDIGYHLEVPPVPLKNDVDAPSPAASVVTVEGSPSSSVTDIVAATPAPAQA